MKSPVSLATSVVGLGLFLGSVCPSLLAAELPAPSPSAAAAPTSARPRTDAHGNPLRYAATGHVSNYDEEKVGHYTLPNPLVLQDGQPVKDAATWTQRRRPEVLRLYESSIYGRVPSGVPLVSASAATVDAGEFKELATRKDITLSIGQAPDGPKVNVVLFLPAKAKGPVPVVLHVTFTGFNPPAPTPIPGSTAPARPRIDEAGPIADLLAKGFGYAIYRYTENQPDSATTSSTGVQALSYRAGQTKPAADEWGTIGVWAWTASRVLDYLATDHAVDAKRVALVGHSRLGKTVLWAGASDPRFALVFSSCAGEMGSALSRRDFGESVDDMANFPWQFADNFQRYAGHWNDLPVDSHLLISLLAPRPVFITGGTQDLWADPVGEYLAAVAAGPVYRLLGKKGLEESSAPPLDTLLVDRDVGFHYHTGGHTITPADWKAFIDFAGRQLHPTP